jgi:sec-independent protein translocase protein TatA
MDLFAPNHLILIALVVLLMFGGKKIPELMRGLGRGVREFNEGKSNVRNELEESTRDRERPVNTSATTSKTTTTQP